jgi:hypothetical protein
VEKYWGLVDNIEFVNAEKLGIASLTFFCNRTYYLEKLGADKHILHEEFHVLPEPRPQDAGTPSLQGVQAVLTSKKNSRDPATNQPGSEV